MIALTKSYASVKQAKSCVALAFFNGSQTLSYGWLGSYPPTLVRWHSQTLRLRRSSTWGACLTRATFSKRMLRHRETELTRAARKKEFSVCLAVDLMCGQSLTRRFGHYSNVPTKKTGNRIIRLSTGKHSRLYLVPSSPFHLHHIITPPLSQFEKARKSEKVAGPQRGRSLGNQSRSSATVDHCDAERRKPSA